MNFEVHNINREKNPVITNHESIKSLFVGHKSEKVRVEDENRTFTQLKAEAVIRPGIKRRSYELPLL